MIASYLRRGMAAWLLAAPGNFRLSSLSTHLVFWAGLGMIFGLLCERASRRDLSGATRMKIGGGSAAMWVRASRIANRRSGKGAEN